MAHMRQPNVMLQPPAQANDKDLTLRVLFKLSVVEFPFTGVSGCWLAPVVHGPLWTQAALIPMLTAAFCLQMKHSMTIQKNCRNCSKHIKCKAYARVNIKPGIAGTDKAWSILTGRARFPGSPWTAWFIRDVWGRALSLGRCNIGGHMVKQYAEGIGCVTRFQVHLSGLQGESRPERSPGRIFRHQHRQ